MEKEIKIGFIEALFLIVVGALFALSFLVSPLIAFVFFAIVAMVLGFTLFPKIGLLMPFIGIILLRPIFLMAGIERAIMLFLIILFFALFSLFLNREKISLPILTPILSVFLILAFVFFLNYFHSLEKTYGAQKLGIFFINSFLPFLIIQFLYKDEETLSKVHRIFLILGTYMVLVSCIQLMIKGVGSYERFTVGRGPIGYARTMGLFILVGMYSFDREKSHIYRLLSIFVFTTSTFFLILGATRGPFIAVFMAVFLYVFFLSKTKLKTKLLLPLIMGGFLYFFIKKGAYLFVRLERTGVGQELSANYRYILWKTGFHHLFDSPVFGSGTGSFASMIPVNLKATELVYPHNIFLEFMIEHGLIGLSLLLILFSICAFYSIKLMFWEDKKQIGLNGHLGIMLVFYGITNAQISSDISGNYLLWASISLLGVIYYTKKHQMSLTSSVQSKDKDASTDSLSSA